jgi:hypothetical protein
MSFRNLKTIAAFFIFFFISFNSFAGIVEEDEAENFANFIQALIHNTQTVKNGATCIFGSDRVSKVIANREKNFIDLSTDPKKFNSCKAIYIAQEREKTLRAEISKFNNNKILTIATFDGFTEMGGIIQVQLGRRDFELILNSKEAKEAGVKLNALSTSLVIN